ncbi:MAG: 3-phosphoshikimate 1-carboxyvinyltransferase [Candidatus Omnitrophota bacterium]|nr:MAG: 3-phosphoshikimate 1-carboxyvinyltransferase [Candidatus Omnitrophota bacterium]
MKYEIKPPPALKKEIKVPPDKSISHRAVMLSSLCKGKTVIKPFLKSDDTLATLHCMSRLGVNTYLKDYELVIEGSGLQFPCNNAVRLYAQDSGTTMRILSGLLCAQKIPSIFEASPSLERRPMKRITIPLRMMGANIEGKRKGSNEYPPLTIIPVKKLKGIKYALAVASAQVKSAIMLAALYADKPTTISEPFQSRDHTERMLKLFKARIRKKGKAIICQPTKNLISPKKVFIPGDFSSASFFIILGLILKNSQLRIKNVNINPTRCGLLKVLKRMGANIRIVNKKGGYEPYADIIVKSSKLKATKVAEKEIPLMIDEIPILCVAAAFAKGKTIINGVEELVIKETNRVSSMIFNLLKAGVKVGTLTYPKKSAKQHVMLSVEGKKQFKAADFKSFNDHRTAMSMVIFAMAAQKSFTIDNIKCINKSFPEFIPLINSLY